MRQILILITLFLSLTSFSQKISRDTIYIKIENNLDFKIYKENVLIFKITNPLYQKELNKYKEMIERHKNKPLPLVPSKPSKDYSFHTIGKYTERSKRSSENIKYFPKKNMNSIRPHRTLIYMVEEMDCSLKLYPVTFYQNVIE